MELPVEIWALVFDQLILDHDLHKARPYFIHRFSLALENNNNNIRTTERDAVLQLPNLEKRT